MLDPAGEALRVAVLDQNIRWRMSQKTLEFFRATLDRQVQALGGKNHPRARAVETQVLVSDGQTVVLGGIYETERRETITKVPVLGDIPGVGNLFKSRQNVSNKAELLIFVTPKILTEGSSIY